MKMIKKILIDLIPGFMFTFATLVMSQSIKLLDSCSIVGYILFVLAYASLDLHTYLINKLNKE